MEFNQNVVMFVGKGGVGKTTISAATALHFALNGYKTLIISTDPAPSLSDMFEIKIGEKETEILKGLYAIELSFSEVLRRWKEKFGGEIYEVISSFADFEYDIVDYVGSAPGIDEEFMLDYIYTIFLEGKYDKIVWDTAPMGHTLRLLKFPGKFIDHLNDAFKVYINLFNYMEKIKVVVGEKKRNVFDIIKKWRDLAEEILNFMRNPENVCYVAITIPEALGVQQTKRAIEEFKNFGLKINAIVINNVILQPDCEFHRKRKEMQEKYTEEIKNFVKGKDIPISIIPMFADEIKGIEKIKKVEEILFNPISHLKI